MNNSLNELTALLSKDERLVIDGRLAKNKIIELALQLDKELIRLLRTSEKISKLFFQQVDDVLIFDKEKFISFVSNKSFLPDSFTEYKNKIGLTSNKHYLTDSKEVVLDWPYKDCVLEGGQTKEDAKRNEVFWNETLAPDEIDRLLEPKVFTNFKRYGKNGEAQVENLTQEDNLIIKGNNLIALHSLYKVYQGKVKLIYIDPPYYYANKKQGDSFLYNSTFKLSTWLVFMKNRLEIAKKLLTKDGVMFIQISNEGKDYLRVLCDEIFTRDKLISQIKVKTLDPSGFKSTSDGLFKSTEDILFYANDRKSALNNLKDIFIEKEYDTAYRFYLLNKEESYEKWKWLTISEYLATQVHGHESAKEYEKIVGKEKLKEEIKDFAFNNADRVFRTAAISGGAFAKRKETISLSRGNPKIVFKQPNDDLDDFYIISGEHSRCGEKKRINPPQSACF